jgi:hypothetical protein
MRQGLWALYLSFNRKWPLEPGLTPIILATQEAEIRRIAVQSQLGQIVPETPILKKKKTQNRAGRVAQVVEHLLCQPEVLSSNPGKKKKKKENGSWS